MFTLLSHSLILSTVAMGIQSMRCTGLLKSLKTSARSKFLIPYPTRSRLTISMSSRLMTKKGHSISSTRQWTVGMRKDCDLKGTPWNPSSRKGMSNSRSSSRKSRSHSSDTRLTKLWNSELVFLRRSRSRCSSSISSGSYMLRRCWSSDSTASITFTKNCRSLDFFLPTMMGSCRWKWMSVTHWSRAFSAGWKKACLMFL
mmetsp:Transcript_36834/g.80242  ORF Transcript_36834/g.80242 Transcript_36834/m.80242 type:complete len:200 (-) Transcript_36834:732-1331(-)